MANKFDYSGDGTLGRLLTRLKSTLAGYAKQSEVADLSEAIADQQTAINSKLPKNFGADNVGKILVVGSDGNLTLTDMPEGGASGDVVGVLDESKNILLTGDIAEGTYPLKWLMTDGTYADAGTLTVTLTPEPEVVINWIADSVKVDDTPFVGTNGEKGYKTGYRLSNSSGNESAQSGYEVTGFIPVKYGDNVYIKNVTLAGDGKCNVAFYRADKSFIVGTYTTSVFTASNGGAHYGAITNANIGLDAITTDIAFMRVSSSDITENSIITINQPIE